MCQPWLCATPPCVQHIPKIRCTVDWNNQLSCRLSDWSPPHSKLGYCGQAPTGPALASQATKWLGHSRFGANPFCCANTIYHQLMYTAWLLQSVPLVTASAPVQQYRPVLGDGHRPRCHPAIAVDGSDRRHQHYADEGCLALIFTGDRCGRRRLAWSSGSN
jgi:hypothetical protein